MPRPNISTRLEKLEARLEGISGESESMKTCQRAIEVLCKLLPDIPEVVHQEQTAPAGFTLKIVVAGIKSISRIKELGSRIEAGRLTDNDRDTLADLQRHAGEELRLIELNAPQFAWQVAEALRLFDARYSNPV